MVSDRGTFSNGSGVGRKPDDRREPGDAETATAAARTGSTGAPGCATGVPITTNSCEAGGAVEVGSTFDVGSALGTGRRHDEHSQAVSSVCAAEQCEVTPKGGEAVTAPSGSPERSQAKLT